MRASFWWGWLTVTGVVFAVFWALLHVLGVDPRPGPLLLLVALVTAVLALVNINLVSDGPSWDVHSSQPVTEPGQDARLGMYTRALSGHLDAKTVDPVLRDRLADLTSARLQQRHGVGLRDPVATELLGREVADLLTGPPRRLARGEIETAVRRIEGL